MLDPKKEENPLTNTEEEDEEDEEGEEAGEDEEETEDKSDDSDIDVNESDMDDEKETALDKLRSTVREALHQNGYQTDDESVDMDCITEEEGDRLNAVLGDAFRGVKPSRGRNAKQGKDEKTLTHFRVRVVDLIEMYLDAEPKMYFCLEIAFGLLQVLEFAIRDVHEKPLENRVRGCLKKLTGVKKFSDADGVDESVLVTMLESLLEKGSKSSLMYQDMGDKISECVVFLIRCCQTVAPAKPRRVLKGRVFEIVRTALEQYFTKRDCLLPVVLFKSIVQTSWGGVFGMLPILVSNAFDDDIRPFRRSQALELLRIFYQTNRLRVENPEAYGKHTAPVEAAVLDRSVQLLRATQSPSGLKVKEKYISNLFNLLSTMKSGAPGESPDWAAIGELARQYRSTVALAKDAKVAYNKLCRCLGVSNLVKMNIAAREVSEDEESVAEKAVKPKAPRKTKAETKRKRKEAKMLRAKVSSEGLEEVDFSNVRDEEEKEEEDEEVVPRKKKKGRSF